MGKAEGSGREPQKLNLCSQKHELAHCLILNDRLIDKRVNYLILVVSSVDDDVTLTGAGDYRE